MVSIKLPNVGIGDGIILNPSRDWEFGSGRGFVVGGMGGSMTGAEDARGAGGTGAGRAVVGGGGCEEEGSMLISRSCCCSNIFSRAVLHLMRVGRGTLQSNTHTVYVHTHVITVSPCMHPKYTSVGDT